MSISIDSVLILLDHTTHVNAIMSGKSINLLYCFNLEF